MTKTQATRDKNRARARAGAARTRARATRVRGRARRAAAQAAPLAVSARMTARQRWYRARIWAAPRLERTGQTLERRVAPKMAAMLTSAAHRIDPVPARRRRWPLVAGGLVLAAGLSGTAAYLLNRRGPRQEPLSGAAETPASSVKPEMARKPAESDVDGRVHTS